MTKAKRYEGEALRAARWEAEMRDRVWKRIEFGVPELKKLFKDYQNCGYALYVYEQFNHSEVCFEVTTRLYHGYDRGGIRCTHGPIIFEHVEPFEVFPSDHLKTKLLLLAD